MTQRSLDPGTQIARYRVVSLLGAGGMGEVYLARDESLDRSVALKVLPPDLVKNEERVRRFVQEAKSASSLNHPHIVTIYEIGEAEIGGDDSPAEKIQFIAMELVSGHTLKTLIHQEKTDLKTLVRYIAQAADGLAKAHAAGIVHRDLKPENIMVTSDGFAKVVDFGLAKLTETASSATDLTSAPTELARATGAGVVLGTIGYMSPEQVQGKTVDHRSDIFSLGCVLYEAATRRRPFEADSDVETLHKILKERPPAIEEINPDVPGELRRVIRRCLAKSPDQRWQGMKDLALELSELADEYDTLSASSGSGTQVSSAVMGEAPASRRTRAIVVGALSVAVLALATAVWSLVFRDGRGEGGDGAVSLEVRRVMSDPMLGEAALSPDGRQLAFTRVKGDDSGLWIRQLVTGSELRLADNAGGRPDFSPDGAFVFYSAVASQEASAARRDPAIYRVPSLGGAPSMVVDGFANEYAVSPDGSQIAYGCSGFRDDGDTGCRGLAVAGLVEPGERVVSDILPNGLAWAPDGATIAAVRAVSSTPDRPVQILLVSVSGNQTAEVTLDDLNQIRGMVWLDDSELAVLGRAVDRPDDPAQLWLVTLPQGRARRLTSDVSGFIGLSGSSDGRTLAAIQRRIVREVWAAPAANPDAGTRLVAGDARLRVRAASPELVILESSSTGIWSMRPDGSALRQLTPGSFRQVDSPQVDWASNTIYFDGIRDDRVRHVWRMTTDGRDLQQVTDGDRASLVALAPDGQSLLFSRAPFGGRGVLRMPVAGGDPEPVEDFPALAMYFGYSPDGRLRLRWDSPNWILEPAAGGDEIRRWSGEVPSFAWPPAGNAVDYMRQIDGVENIWRMPIDGGEPRQLTHFTTPGLHSFVLSNDGSTFFYTRMVETTSDVVLITNFHRDDGGSR